MASRPRTAGTRTSQHIGKIDTKPTRNGGDDHNGVTDIGDDGDGDDFNNGVMVMVMMVIAKVVSVMVMIAPTMMGTWS